METSDQDRIRAEVRSAYGAVARGGAEGCCGPAPVAVDSQRLGYSSEELSAVPEGADLGLGCGNPTGLADLKPGETVLDLGSGAGFDCFLAARQVGPTGRVVGVDMTAEMIAKARANAVKAGLDNVEFRLGEIEALPVADGSVDAILSNCVVNLSPDKERVFREAFRVLRPGGRLAVSDMVATEDLPEEVKADLHLYSCCIGGASPIAEIESALAAAGFAEIRIVPKDGSRELVREWAPGRGVEDLVVSASIQAIKPQSSPRHQPSPSPMNPETDRAPPLHASIVALVALAANIAANHPKQGLCQVERLKDLGVPESQIRAAVEIARHIRDEAPGLLDRQFDEKVESLLGATPKNPAAPAKPQSVEPKLAAGTALPVAAAPCCTPTKSGQSCC